MCTRFKVSEIVICSFQIVAIAARSDGYCFIDLRYQTGLMEAADCNKVKVYLLSLVYRVFTVFLNQAIIGDLAIFPTIALQNITL
jgi:hypothetical protein